jgi:hypothetical protein
MYCAIACVNPTLKLFYFIEKIGFDIYAILLIDLKRARDEPKTETLIKFLSVSYARKNKLLCVSYRRKKRLFTFQSFIKLLVYSALLYVYRIQLLKLLVHIN